jgi:hypothetical protein
MAVAVMVEKEIPLKKLCQMVYYLDKIQEVLSSDKEESTVFRRHGGTFYSNGMRKQGRSFQG